MIPSPRLPNILSILIAAAFAFISLAVLNDFGLNWDEPGNIHYGNLLLQYYESGLQNLEVFGWSNLYYYGGIFDLTGAFFAKYFNLNVIHVRHFLSVSIGTFGLWLAWWLGNRIAGRWAGFTALTSLASWPIYFGHSHVNGKDLPFAVAMLAICASIVWSLEAWPKPKAKHIIALGFAAAFAFGIRISAVLSIVIFYVILFGFLANRLKTTNFRQLSSETLAFLLKISLFQIITVPTVVFFWPWVAQDYGNILKAIEVFSKFDFKGSELFNGTLVPAKNLPWYYVPLLMIYQLPEIIVTLAPFIMIFAFKFWRKLPTSFYACFAFFAVPFLIVFITKPAMYNSLRHMFLIMPPFIVVAAAGAVLMLRNSKPVLRNIAACAFAANWVLSISTNAQLHPYQYLAFNQFIGGVKGAEPNFAIDYWGLSLRKGLEKFAALYPNANPNAKDGKYTLLVCGEPDSLIPYLPYNFRTEKYSDLTAINPDFTLALNAFYCEKLMSKKELFKIGRSGATFVRGYEK